MKYSISNIWSQSIFLLWHKKHQPHPLVMLEPGNTNSLFWTEYKWIFKIQCCYSILLFYIQLWSQYSLLLRWKTSKSSGLMDISLCFSDFFSIFEVNPNFLWHEENTNVQPHPLDMPEQSIWVLRIFLFFMLRIFWEKILCIFFSFHVADFLNRILHSSFINLIQIFNSKYRSY